MTSLHISIFEEKASCFCKSEEERLDIKNSPKKVKKVYKKG